MQCDVCQAKEATVFLTQIVDGKMQKVNLCESCSKEKGVTDPLSFALVDLLPGLGAEAEVEKGTPVQHCPVCGFTQADFKKTGRLGCPVCYDTFAEGLSGLLKAMHRRTTHTGKVPARLKRSLEMGMRRKQLQRDLDKAVSEENYESAAQLRDQLRELEQTT